MLCFKRESSCKPSVGARCELLLKCRFDQFVVGKFALILKLSMLFRAFKANVLCKNDLVRLCEVRLRVSLLQMFYCCLQYNDDDRCSLSRY